MSTPVPSAPEKLPAAAIFALLDGAPFGRLTTYAPPAEGTPGRCYVVPLQFIHREGRLFLITTPGRKLANLRAAPQAPCFQLDLTEGAGWTSVCAWGTYEDVTDLRRRLSVVSAFFSKYPDRTTRQAVSWLRQHTPRLGQAAGPSHAPAVGCIQVQSMSGRSWLGLQLSVGPALIRPRHGTPQAAAEQRGRPLALDRTACLALLAARPLARVGCYHPSRGRCYCVPLWYVLADHGLWFYYPPGGEVLLGALREHPHGVCAQVDDLDCSPQADPGQPWRSVVGEGSAALFALDAAGELPPARQAAIVRAIRARLHAFAIHSVFVPPDPAVGPPSGWLIHLRLQTIAGQATGTPR